MDFIKPCFGVRIPTGEGKCSGLKTLTMVTELKEMGFCGTRRKLSKVTDPYGKKNYLGGLRFSRDEEDWSEVTWSKTKLPLQLAGFLSLFPSVNRSPAPSTFWRASKMRSLRSLCPAVGQYQSRWWDWMVNTSASSFPYLDFHTSLEMVSVSLPLQICQKSSPLKTILNRK